MNLANHARHRFSLLTVSRHMHQDTRSPCGLRRTPCGFRGLRRTPRSRQARDVRRSPPDFMKKRSVGVRGIRADSVRTPTDSDGLRGVSRNHSKSPQKCHFWHFFFRTPSDFCGVRRSPCGVRMESARSPAESGGLYKKKSVRSPHGVRRSPHGVRRSPSESVGVRAESVGVRTESARTPVSADLGAYASFEDLIIMVLM